MSIWLFLLLILICTPAFLVGLDFLALLVNGKRLMGRGLYIIELIIMGIAVAYLWSDTSEQNLCCGDSALFSPEHRLSIMVLVALSLIAYFYSSYRRSIAPPLVEVITNCLALAAMDEAGPSQGGRLERWCQDLLHLKPFYKIPILLILCLPILVVLAGLLLLFGQRPDSMIRAFTDTYQHGLSQWDHQCDGVVCGGHFLCTIAAKGHESVVRPIRSGVRGGQKIICNRQLLVSNAFEELLEQRLPGLHRPIRKFYNRVGRQIHRHYALFNHKWVSDSIYILMKPLEWCFLLFLYTFDRRPENRIAQQYLKASERRMLAAALPLRQPAKQDSPCIVSVQLDAPPHPAPF